MSFTFVHSADWHIGKAFGGFEADKAALLRDARRRAVEAIACVARERGASHVLVAGDVFDSEGLSDDVLRRQLALLKGGGDLTWHLLPGNHDPDREHGVWARLAAFSLPDNVIVHRRAEPVDIAPRVTLWPAPLGARHVEQDPTHWFATAARRDDATVIGLAHGPVSGFGGEGGSAGLIDAGRAAASGLDYLALGDWHGAREVNARSWYSGTPEATGFVDNDAGHVLVVTLDAPGAEPSVEKVATGHFAWRRLALDVRPTETADAVVEHLDCDGQSARELVRLVLSGSTTLGGQADLRAHLDALAPSYFDLTVRWDGLSVVMDGNGEEFLNSPEVAEIAARLAVAARDTADQSGDGEVAQRALHLLGGFAHMTRGG